MVVCFQVSRVIASNNKNIINEKVGGIYDWKTIERKHGSNRGKAIVMYFTQSICAKYRTIRPLFPSYLYHNCLPILLSHRE